jgi:hypothetical protein
MTMTKPTSEQVTFLAAGSGATQRNLVDKVRESVSAADFGAVGDGVADDTAALKAAFDYAIPLSRTVLLRGTYKVTGPITSSSTIASGGLHIICDGAVRVTVDAGSTAFFSLFQMWTNSANSTSILGGSLDIELNQRCANGIYIRYFNLEDGGTVEVSCPVTIRNAYAQASVTQDAGGFRVLGPVAVPYGAGYSLVSISSMSVLGVGRSGTGVCIGIGVSGYTGKVLISNCRVSNVLSVSGASPADADGIGVFGQIRTTDSTFTKSRLGQSTISDCTFIDCQGRSFKSQCSACSVIRPTVYRKDVIGSASCTDFDFQYGNGSVVGARFEYRLNGGVSPLDASHIPVAFRNWIDDVQSASTCSGAVMLSEATAPRFVSAQYETYCKRSRIDVTDCTFIPAGVLAGTSTSIIDGNRAIVEISNTENISTSNSIAEIAVIGCSGQFGSSCIAYTGWNGGAISSLLVPTVVGNVSTVQSANANAFRRISGSIIDSLDSFVFRDNHNVSAVFMNFSGVLKSVDLTKICVGNRIVLDLDSIISGGGSITGSPPLDTVSGATATVEVLAQGSSATDNSKVIRIVNTTTPSGTPRRSQVFVSIDNASTWIREDDASPLTVTADATVGAWESSVINNKSGSTCVLTFPSASLNVGRRILVKTIQAQAVDSASSNVVPLAGGAAGTAILTGTAGKYAELVSDGTNWVIMAAN